MAKLFNMSPIAMVIRSIKAEKFRLVNQKFTELYGYTLEDMDNIKRNDLVHQEDKETIALNMEKLIAGEAHQEHFQEMVNHYRKSRRNQRLQQSRKIKGNAQLELQVAIEREFTENESL